MNKKIKLLHIVSLLEIGGLETLVLEMLKRVDRGRYFPMVCVMKTGGSLQKEFEAASIPVYVVEKKDGIDLSLPFKLARLIREKEIDIIHTHNVFAWIYGGIASKLLNSVILIHTEHANTYPHWKMLRMAERILAKFTNRIIAVAKKVSDVMGDRDGISRKKIEVIYNGVDIEEYDKTVVVGSVAEHLINKDKTNIGIVARLCKVKDHKSLLDALSLVNKVIAKVKLLIVGDGELREDLEAYAKAKGIQDHVLFLGNRRDVPELLRVMDVFVLSSISEGMPMTLLEAMAAGLPIVATDVGGNRDVVIDRETGFLVPPRNPQGLAEAISILLKDKKMASEFGKKGQARCKELFSLNEMVKKYSQIYESVLKQ